VRIDDLNISELLEFDSEEGVVRFAGERAVPVAGSLPLTATRRGKESLLPADGSLD